LRKKGFQHLTQKISKLYTSNYIEATPTPVPQDNDDEEGPMIEALRNIKIREFER